MDSISGNKIIRSHHLSNGVGKPFSVRPAVDEDLNSLGATGLTIS